MASRRTDAVLRALGLRIQELRRARGETQESLAGRLDMLPTNYARIEQGRQNVTVDTLVRVANALDAAPADLFAAPKRRRSRPGRPRKRDG